MTMKTRAELERENEILREKLAELTELLEDDEADLEDEDAEDDGGRLHGRR